ncbi:MAG: AI-2E family transporter [Desulfosarcinaceae bacterium]|nr:AI-2E family transporter [Desulfosarcinaceae bacterium]
MEPDSQRSLILWFFLICFLISFLLLGKLFAPFFSIIVLSGVLTGIFYPLYRLLQFDNRVRPPLASFLTCLILFFILFVPIALFIGVLTQEAFGLYELARNAVRNDQIKNLLQNSEVLERANTFLAPFNIEVTGDQLQTIIAELGKVVGLFLYEQARAIASNTLATLINLFLMLLVIFFLLIDGPRLIGYIVDLSPLPKDQEDKLIQKFNDMAGAILIGNGLGGLIQGTLGGLLFWVVGLPSAFVWGVIMGLLAFLPIIGIGVIFIPTAIFLALKGRVGMALFFFVYYLLLSGGTEYLFKPRLVGQRVKMHTLLVFFAIIGGLKVFGILGIVYGPLIATAFLTLADIYRTSYQKQVESDRNRV